MFLAQYPEMDKIGSSSFPGRLELLETLQRQGECALEEGAGSKRPFATLEAVDEFMSYKIGLKTWLVD